MTDQRDTPDTRTPSAEGCGHSAHATDEDGRRVGADGGVLPTRTMRWELCPLPGQGSDAPSAPNRAPTDDEWGPYLAEQMRDPEFRAAYAAAAALEDLTRENERLRAELQAQREVANNIYQQRGFTT